MCRFNILKKLSLVLSYVKRNFHSLLKRGDRSKDSVCPIDKSLIQVQRKPCEFKFKEFIPPLLVGLRNSVTCSNRKVCWKTKFLSSLSVGQMVKGDWVGYSAFKGYLRNVVADISKRRVARIFCESSTVGLSLQTTVLESSI